MEESFGLLDIKKISKKFGETQALKEVDFHLRTGEVHALMGENGAGKSTLGKILSGIHDYDSGHIYLNGKEIYPESPGNAKQLGISIVLQEFNMIPDLSVAENLFLADEKYYRLGFVLKKKEIIRQSRYLLDLFEAGSKISPNEFVRNLSIAQMQILEILKAVNLKSQVIILDEPTAALSSSEVKELFEIIIRLKKEQNIGFVIVSHKIEEIFKIADRVTVLRDGELIIDGMNISELSENDLVKYMVGREVKDLYGNRVFGTDLTKEIALEIKDIVDLKGYLKKISLQVRKGEIVGLTGLVGAGRTELARCISGIDKLKSGEVIVKGKRVYPNTIKNSIRSGIVYVPEDRKNDGLILNHSISHNISLAYHNIHSSFIISGKNEKEILLQMKNKMKIKMKASYLSCNTLSGGNQQKVLLGKWLLVNPEILIIDEPTRGIDIAAKSEIYSMLNKLAEDGVAILVISSDQPEVIGVCDRIIVMREGELAGELFHSEVTEQKITRLATLG